MSTIRANYEKINSEYKFHKQNSDNSLLIEIYDQQDEQLFFENELKKISKKLFQKLGPLTFSEFNSYFKFKKKLREFLCVLFFLLI